MSVYEGIEGEAVSPAGGEVLDVDLRVPGAQRNLYLHLGCTNPLTYRTSYIT